MMMTLVDSYVQLMALPICYAANLPYAPIP